MTEKPNPVVRFLPSLTDVAFLMPLVFLFSRLEGAKTMLGDGDTGWHVRAGEWIIAHRAIPHTDLFSFTKPGQPWFAWEWLWELCFGWLHLHWGLGPVVAVSILVLCLTSALVFRLTERTSGNRFIAIAVTFLMVAGSAMHWLARPHLFTLLFTVIWLTMLNRVEEGRTRLLWLMPALTVLWTNLHGGFLAGIILLAIYAAGSFATWLFEVDPDTRRKAIEASRRYALTALGCAAASLVNPFTYHLHQHIFRYFRDPYSQENISEFQSLSFHHPAAIYLEVMLGLALLMSAWNLARRNFTPVLLVAGWAHVALVGARNIPLFLIVAAPLVAQGLSEMIRTIEEGVWPAWLLRLARGLRESAQEFGTLDSIPRFHAVSAAAIVLIAVLLQSDSKSPKLHAEYAAENYPVAALEAHGQELLGKRTYTDDEWGDYLVYRSHPSGGKVFVDGRSDFYGSEFGKTYLDLVNVQYGWQQTLDRYGVDALLLRANSSLAGAAKESRRWHVEYDDGIAIIFAPSGTNAGKLSATLGADRKAGPETAKPAGGALALYRH